MTKYITVHAAPPWAWLLLAAACTIAAPAQASGPGPLDESLNAASRLAGPLALSADGLFRVHGDGTGTLHRVELARLGNTASLSLSGVHALQLAASRTARKVAFVTSGGCLGVADFGAQPPAVAWAPRTKPDEDPNLSAPIWPPQPPNDCEGSGPGYAGPHALALSADGRLLAWRDTVLDLVTHRVRAHLPAQATTLRFVDADRKLLASVLTSGYVDEGASSADGAQVLVWNLADGALQGVVSDDHGPREDPLHLFAAYAPVTGLVWWADTARWRGDTRQARDGSYHTVLRLVAAQPAQCGAATPRAQLEDPYGDVLVVDPFGRWAATVQPQDSARARLTFFDLVTGRAVGTRDFQHELRGTVVGADGSKLYVLAVPGYEVRDIAVPPALLRNARDPLASPPDWQAACPVAGEGSGARQLPPAGGPLTKAWTLQLPVTTDPGPTYNPLTAVFVRPDGSLWLKRPDGLAQLDPTSGKVLRTLPLPAGPQARSRYHAASDGFVNAQGDTLTWRRVEGGGRRVIASRPGWYVEAINLSQRKVMVMWAHHPAMAATPAAPEASASTPDARRFAEYEIVSGRPLSDQPAQEGMLDDWDYQPHSYGSGRPPCQGEQGSMAVAFDWRIDMVNSVRAWRCGPEGTRTWLWSGLDLQQQPSPPWRDMDVAAVSTYEGSLAVVQD